MLVYPHLNLSEKKVWYVRIKIILTGCPVRFALIVIFSIVFKTNKKMFISTKMEKSDRVGWFEMESVMWW